MAMSPEELVAFIAIEGDHFDALVEAPDLYTKQILERIVVDEESPYNDPATFEDLVYASAGEDRTGMYLIAVSGGWTFLSTPFDYPGTDFGYMMRLSRHFKSRAFQIDFSNFDYSGGAYIICDEAGEVIRYVSRNEYQARSECSVLGDPLPEEAEMADLWETDDVMRLFVSLGMPDVASPGTWHEPFEKSAWFEPDTGPFPQGERDAVSAIHLPVYKAARETKANDPTAFINFVSDEEIEAEEQALVAEYKARNRGGTIIFRTILCVIAAAIAAGIYLLFF